eukprot:scpid38043/ scgid1495/ 
MVNNTFNHPSIIIWAFLNEGASNKKSACDSAYVPQASRYRELGVNGLVSWASNKKQSDVCLDNADVVSFNSYPGWYGDSGDYSLQDQLGTVAPAILEEASWAAVNQKKPFIKIFSLYRWNPAYSLLSRQNFLSTATAASTGPVQSMPPARVATEPRFTTGEDSIRTIPADSELLSATPSTISKFSDMGSVSSLTTSDSEPSTSRHANIETQTTAAAIAENPYLTPADRRSEECRSGHVEAARMPSHGLANGGHDDGDVTSSFTASTAQLLDYSSTLGDLSRHTGISTDTAVAPGGTSTQAQATSAQPAGHSGPIPMMSEEFMHDFLTDHMSVLQTRIEETIEKLGLTKEAT